MKEGATKENKKANLSSFAGKVDQTTKPRRTSSMMNSDMRVEEQAFIPNTADSVHKAPSLNNTLVE